MRILHLITHLRLGAGRAIVDLAVAQARAGGHDVTVVTADDAEGHWCSDERLVRELDHAGVSVEGGGDFFHRSPSALATSAGRLRSLVGRWTDETIVHAHTAMAAAVARWADAPFVVVTCHGWNPERAEAYNVQDALALSLADAIISPSRYWADEIARLPGEPQATVVPNGFDLSRYPLLERTADSGTLRIGCIGEVTRRKGQDVLIDAMPLVWREHATAELHLFGDGDMTASLKERAAHLDPTGARIHFHGHVHDAYHGLARCDLFCLPSRSDNQPVALIEAMLAELAVVSTTVGGIPEMVHDAGCGQVVAPESSAALAIAICQYADRAVRDIAGRRGRAFAQQHFDRRITAARMTTLYAHVALSPTTLVH